MISNPRFFFQSEGKQEYYKPYKTQTAFKSNNIEYIINWSNNLDHIMPNQ